MSIENRIFAERRINGLWTLIGEPTGTVWCDCQCPPTALCIPPRNELITVLCGFQTTCWGVDNTGLEIIISPRGLPDDLSPVLRAWAELHIRENLADRRRSKRAALISFWGSLYATLGLPPADEVIATMREERDVELALR